MVVSIVAGTKSVSKATLNAISNKVLSEVPKNRNLSVTFNLESYSDALIIVTEKDPFKENFCKYSLDENTQLLWEYFEDAGKPVYVTSRSSTTINIARNSLNNGVVINLTEEFKDIFNGYFSNSIYEHEINFNHDISMPSQPNKIEPKNKITKKEKNIVNIGCNDEMLLL